MTSNATLGAEHDTMHSRSHYPLDPLSMDEIQHACDILKNQKHLSENYRFANVTLNEPHKDEILNFNVKKPLDRSVFICVFDSKKNEAYEAIVNLTSEKVTKWKNLQVHKPPYGQPPILIDEFSKVERIVKAHPAWRNAMKKRGLNDEQIDNIQVDPYCPGYFNKKNEKGKRVLMATSYYREHPTDNAFAHPIEGVLALVDMNAECVLELIDEGKNTPIPLTKMNYDSESYPEKRKGLKPLLITQPEGASFNVNGWEVEWQNWKFRVGFTPREGLVLYQVSYHDGDRDRPIIYRASVNEMLVPYSDPNVNHERKCAFDAGEYGLGKLADSLKLGCDCKGHIYYFNVAAADDFGNAINKENAVCMHEEDAGNAWKQNGSLLGSANEVRRARELVVSFFTTIGNYGYGFYWRFAQDGSLKLEVKLNGIVQTAAVYPGTKYKWGGHLTRDLVAPSHQHFFNARLDMMVDGKKNSFSQTEYTRLPIGRGNLFGNAFGQVTREFKREDQAICDANAKKGRTWNIYNPSFKNAIGNPTAYQLKIPQDPLMLANRKSYIAKRGKFAKHNVWVTPYDINERYAAGDYPNQHAGGDGVSKYVKQKRKIRNKQLVLWVTFGPTHTPRPEDGPVMSSTSTALQLIPYGFFSRNPAMDLPKERDLASVQHKQDEEHGCCRRVH